jgi:hypothetical protein
MAVANTLAYYYKDLITKIETYRLMFILGATTFSIMTLSFTTLSMMGLFVTLSIIDTKHR